jgi:hypothetical protein
MQLPAPDIDRINAGRAAFDQHLCEAAGRSAGVKTDAAIQIEAEGIESRRQLHAAARDVMMRRLRVDFRICINLIRRFANRNAVREDKSRCDSGLRLCAALEDASLDQNTIGTLTSHSHSQFLFVHSVAQSGTSSITRG